MYLYQSKYQWLGWCDTDKFHYDICIFTVKLMHIRYRRLWRNYIVKIHVGEIVCGVEEESEIVRQSHFSLTPLPTRPQLTRMKLVSGTRPEEICLLPTFSVSVCIILWKYKIVSPICDAMVQSELPQITVFMWIVTVEINNGNMKYFWIQNPDLFDALFKFDLIPTFVTST